MKGQLAVRVTAFSVYALSATLNADPTVVEIDIDPNSDDNIVDQAAQPIL